MTDLERFQGEHGAAWSATVGSPSFLAAFTLSNLEKIQAIAALTDDEIATHGKIILADLRGHLKYETALISLHERKTFAFGDLPEPDYPDPAAEAELSETESATTAGQPIVFQVPPETPEPRKKRKYRKRRKKKKPTI